MHACIILQFYQSGSSFTKFRAAQKAKLDASFSDATGRGAAQVLACSLAATLLSGVVYSVSTCLLCVYFS